MKISLFLSLFLFLSHSVAGQVTVGFQGGEPGDTWGFTSTGADPTAMSERLMSPNIVSGTASLVVGGNTSGGSCIDGGSGNGPNTLRKFTFNPLDISSSSNSIRTFTINWGNRFPACVGTGWDSAEDLVITVFHDGVAQAPVTLAGGNNNATFSINTHQYTASIPVCVNSFYFEIGVTTNRRDELLFIDNIKVTAPALNGPVAGVSPIVGNNAVCVGAPQTLSVTPTANTTYTWSGLPAGASFTSANGTTTSNVMNINWGTAAPGTYTISVTPSTLVCGVATPGAPATISITVSSAPQLVVTSDTTICAGASVQITASGATSYTWNNGLGSGSSFLVTPATTTTYLVTGSNGNCSSTDSVKVTVAPAPVISIASPSLSICSGGTATLTASGGTSYTWQPAQGLGTTTGSVVTVNPSATTTYTVSGSNGTCSANANITITVVNNPQLVVSGSTTICDGEAVTISASGATTYNWDNGLGAGSSFTVTPTATTTYTVTGANGNCTSTGSVTITIAPALVVGATASSTSICAGSTAVLTATGATSYAWQPAATLSSSSGATVTATPTTTTTYTVTGSTGSCQGTATITVNVNTAPAINAGNDVTVCLGDAVTLSASGGTAYSWDNGVTDGVPFVPTASAVYTVTSGAAGCTGMDQVQVTVESQPTVSFTSDVNSGCLPLAVQFASSSPAVIAGYAWNFGDGTSSTDVNPVHVYTSSGCNDVSLEVTSTNGCKSVLTVTNMICNIPNPVASFAINPAELDESNPKANMVNGSENAVSYLWDFGDQSTSVEESPEHLFAPSPVGNYVVTLVAYNVNGCTDTARVTLPFSESPVYYVPNAFTPDGNEMNQTFQPVFTAGFDPFRFHLEIYDRWGERLFESNDHRLGWDGTSVDGTIVPDGTYVWKIGFNVKNSDDRREVKGHVTLVR